ncbi:MAG TPA: threonine synthase [Bellilinea sp.]|nr:threonine synthase [Bellilinea sp.]
MRYSLLTHLECSACQHPWDAGQLRNTCPDCQAPLLARYDLETIRGGLRREVFAARLRGMQRWHELLPVQSPEAVITLGEGDTPLLDLPALGAQLGLTHLTLKDESLNPTGTFKARGQATAISRAKELGASKVIIPTAGNAGGAMAAYASRAGLLACVYMPADTPQANIEECRAVGAEVILVDGLISDAARAVGEVVQQGGWFDVSTFKEPYRLEGKKVMGYELAEAFSWELPDVILYPAGGGMGLVAIWKAFAELEDLGWLNNARKPRMVAVQAAGCAPVVRAFTAGAMVSTFWDNAQTVASGLRVPKSYGDRLVMETLYQSGGTAVAVSDDQILAAQAQLGRSEGIFAAPEGAATVAALPALLEQGWLKPEERVVLLNTGTGLKYLL